MIDAIPEPVFPEDDPYPAYRAPAYAPPTYRYTQPSFRPLSAPARGRASGC